MPEVPKDALRSVVAGIGRILNFADKVRGKSAGSEPAEAGASAASAAPETDAPAAEEAPAETAAPEGAAEAPEKAAEAPASKDAAPETAAPEEAAPETAASGEDEPETATPEPAAELPLPNYDELTIQSVRARLRNLSVAQLRQLIEYEKSHADRVEFVTAFERRIAKVESGN